MPRDRAPRDLFSELEPTPGSSLPEQDSRSVETPPVEPIPWEQSFQEPPFDVSPREDSPPLADDVPANPATSEAAAVKAPPGRIEAPSATRPFSGASTLSPLDAPEASPGAPNERAWLIDVFGVMFQVFHAIPPMTSPAGQPTNAVFGFCRDLLWLIEKQSPTWLICAMDSPGPGHREGWYPAYKANRTEMPEDLRPQIPLLREVFEGFGLPIVQEEGWEADDVLATLAARFASQGTHVAIVTNDKDARQLLSPLVQLYNLRKMTWFNEASLLEDWGIRPDQVVDFQGLVGDAVDNVPGVPLVGPKKAAALLQQFETLEGVLANADKAPGAKLKENLKTFADQARLSQKLVRLNTELTFDFDPALGRRITPNVEKLQALFRRLGFRKLVDDAARILGPNSPAPIVASSGAVSSAASSTDTDDANSLFANLSEGASPQGSSLVKLERTWRTVDTPAALEQLVEELRTRHEVCIDLETTGLDPLRDEIVGWAIAWPAAGEQPGGACYLPVLGPPGSTLLDAKLVVESLRPILENPACRLINQNVKFDLLAMRRVGLVPANIGLDTMVGDYLLDAGARSHNLEVLGQKYLRAATIPISDLIGTGKNQKTMDQIPVERVAEYATEDAELVVRMAPLIEAQLKEAGLWKLYDELERPLIPVLADMEFAGITVDVAELGRQSEELTLTLARLMGEIHELAGREFNIDSPLQLRKILFDELKLPVQKKTKTGPSTDQEVLETLAPLHPLPAKITEHRHLTKLKGTYLDSLPLLVNPYSGRIHTSFNQVVAATGRLSSSDPNLQNIPIRTPEGSRIRKAFISKNAEWRLVCADYSQIELRMLAHFSQDPALVAAFANGDDIHRIVAAQVHHVAPEEVTSEMRRIAKAVNFGVMYGQSPYGLSAALGISREEATTFIDEYFTRYAGVTSFMEEVLDECLATGYAKTILGRRRPIEGVRGPRERNRNRNMAERTGINTVIQGSAADLIKQAMIRVHDRLRRENHPGRLLLQIHDELVLEAPADLAEELGAIVREEMITALPLDVPLEVDLAIGLNWLDAV